MSDFKRKGAVHNGLATLVKAIEQLSGQKIDLKDVDDADLDIRKIREKETREATIELQKKRAENHRNFIQSFYSSNRVNKNFTFESVARDSANSQALTTAEGFCAAYSLYVGADTAPQLLLLQGSAGSGKSVVANCIANHFLIKLWKDVEICSYLDIKKTRTPSATDTNYDADEKNSRYERYCSVDLLIIDSLCQLNDKFTAFDRQVIPELLRSRRARGLPVVATTSVPIMQLHSQLGDEIFESLKEFNVLTSVLFGASRRAPISFGGTNLL